jgi:nitroimidazol reductase NimA-like FMN-containing flavoprotein (pyridoxamine 5'-phosphate oxidase superfamily)
MSQLSPTAENAERSGFPRASIPLSSSGGSTAVASRDLPVTDRTRHRRLHEKGRLDHADLVAVLRAGFVCHLAFVADGVARALPTVYGFDAGTDTVYLHGSVASRSLVESPGQTVCVTVTHVDGLTLARSVFEHGVNYRCAMLYDVPRVVADADEKLHGLRVISEQAAPGQWDYVRQPSRKELAATTLLAVGLHEASVKVSDGYPDDGEGPDADLPVWAGRLPLRHVWGTPEPDPVLRGAIQAPAHISSREGTAASSL